MRLRNVKIQELCRSSVSLSFVPFCSIWLSVCRLPVSFCVLCPLSFLVSVLCPLALFVSVLFPLSLLVSALYLSSVSFCLCPLSCPFLCLSSVWGLSPHLLFVCRPDCLTVCLCRSPVFQSWSVFFFALCATEVSGSDPGCVRVNCRSASNEICVSGLRD